MTMAFISSKPRLDGTNKTYDVTKSDSSGHVGSSVTIAGNNEADKVCNIYDLEGNAYEYVAEKIPKAPTIRLSLGVAITTIALRLLTVLTAVAMPVAAFLFAQHFMLCETELCEKTNTQK